jgi:hypothetical protein
MSSLKYLIVQAIDSTILLFLVNTEALTDDLFKLVNWFYRSIKIATPYPPSPSQFIEMHNSSFQLITSNITDGLKTNNCLLLMTFPNILSITLISHALKNSTFRSTKICNCWVKWGL